MQGGCEKPIITGWNLAWTVDWLHPVRESKAKRNTHKDCLFRRHRGWRERPWRRQQWSTTQAAWCQHNALKESSETLRKASDREYRKDTLHLVILQLSLSTLSSSFFSHTIPFFCCSLFPPLLSSALPCSFNSYPPQFLAYSTYTLLFYILAL